MAFREDMKPIYIVVRNFLEKVGWKVFRADDLRYPRSIIDGIIYAILASDPIIAEVTGNNPNVFYELGWAYAMDQDVLLLTQEEKIPFDVTTERAIKYKADEAGIALLLGQLSHAIGAPRP